MRDVKLTFDRLLSLAIADEGASAPITQIVAQRGDGEVIELVFLEDGERVEWTSFEEFRFVAKPIQQIGWDAAAHALATQWTLLDAGRARGIVNYNVDLLNAMLLHGSDDEKSRLTMEAQFAWRPNGSSTWRRSQAFTFVLHNNVWRGDETAPDGADPEEAFELYPARQAVVIVQPNDVVNSHATANTLLDITGLSAPVVSGALYHFRALIHYTAAATTTGARFTITGPSSPTMLVYECRNPLTATTETIHRGLTSYNLPAACNATSLTTGNLAVVEGFIQPSIDGTLQLRFASEVSGSAITAKAGSALFVTRLTE